MAAEQNNDAERAAFEAHFAGGNLKRDEDGKYAVPFFYSAWEIWQAARRSAAIGEGGLPELQTLDPSVEYCADEMYEYAVNYARDAIAADRRAREAIETLNNPSWGQPDLYSRLNTALTNELDLATKYGKTFEWFTAARGWIDYEAAKSGEPAPQAAQGVKGHEIRELVNTLRDVAVQYRDAQQLRSRIQDVVLPVFQRAQLARQSQVEQDAKRYQMLRDSETIPAAVWHALETGVWVNDTIDGWIAETSATPGAAPPLSSEQQATRVIDLLREARATLEMWKDVAPAVSLCADIDRVLAGEQQAEKGEQ